MRPCGSRVLPLVLLVLAAGCGGGGADDPQMSPAGILRALGIQGDPAPGTAGNFGVFPAHPYMDAADGGWCAFVAPTTDVTKTEVLYVAEPDTVPTVVDVYAVGDAAPAPSDGTIAGIEGVWMCSDGTVLCYVTLAGDTGARTFGVLSAVVAAGAASAKTGVIYDTASLVPALGGGAGTLDMIDTLTAEKDADGTFWFLGRETPGAAIHLLSIEKDGTGLTGRASPGDPLLAAATIVTIDAFGIDPTATFYAFVVTASTGGRRMMFRETGMPTVTEVLKDGDPVPTSAGTVADVHKGGRLIVYAAGQLVWMLEGDLSGSDDVFLFFAPFSLTPYTILARVGLTAPGTGLGVWSSLDTLGCAPGCIVPGVDGGVAGGTSGVTQGTFGVLSAFPVTAIIDTGNLVATPGGIVPATYVDLRFPGRPYDEASGDGSQCVALSFGGTSSLFWRIRAGGIGTTVSVASQGGPATGADTFGSFAASSAHTIANGVFLFRADVSGARTGIYRHGP